MGQDPVAKARSARTFAPVSLLVADTAGRAAPGVHDDEDDRDGDRYENCPKNEPARPTPAGAPMLFSVCAHTLINEAGDPNGFSNRESLTPSLHRKCGFPQCVRGVGAMGGTGLEPVTPSLSISSICRCFLGCGEGFGEVPHRRGRIPAVAGGRSDLGVGRVGDRPAAVLVLPCRAAPARIIPSRRPWNRFASPGELGGVMRARR